jgi:hypothetical protein
MENRPARSARRNRSPGFGASLVLSVAGAVGSCWHVPQGEAASIAQKRPAWTVDLRESGYPVDADPPGVVEAIRQIAFGSADELVVVGAESLFPEPGLVRAFVLDAKSGRIADTTQWTGKGSAYIFPTAKGDYAAVTEAGLVLYSPGLKEALAKSPHSARRASPDGRSLAAWMQVPGHGLTLFLDTANLRPTGAEFLDENVESISRECIAIIGIAAGADGILVECPAETKTAYRTGYSESQPRFVSEDVLAILGRDRVDVINAAAERLFTYSTDGDATFVSASRDGSRFAIVEAFFGYGIHGKLRSERFTVYDVGSRHPIFSTVITELRGQEFGRSGAALSPDGSALAVNSLGIVRLFNLKPPGRDGA